MIVTSCGLLRCLTFFHKEDNGIQVKIFLRNGWREKEETPVIGFQIKLKNPCPSSPKYLVVKYRPYYLFCKLFIKDIQDFEFYVMNDKHSLHALARFLFPCALLLAAFMKFCFCFMLKSFIAKVFSCLGEFSNFLLFPYF